MKFRRDFSCRNLSKDVLPASDYVLSVCFSSYFAANSRFGESIRFVLTSLSCGGFLFSLLPDPTRSMETESVFSRILKECFFGVYFLRYFDFKTDSQIRSTRGPDEIFDRFSTELLSIDSSTVG